MKQTYNLLLVEDDHMLKESLEMVLPNQWKLHWASTLSDIPNKNPQGSSFHAAFVDMHLLPGTKTPTGPKVIKQLRETFPTIEIVAISGDLSLELMEECLECGAQKFLAKPLMADEVTNTLEKIEALWQMRELERSPKKTRWVGTSEKAKLIQKQIAQLRGEKGPILIEGETGTGKEVAFRLLHEQEVTRPLVTVNIASIPENLFESELFGYVKGAFTGADQMRVGLAEAAHGGDLFLDEIEALPLSQQVKLLRFLETGEVRKVGSKETIHVNVRVIVATNQNLGKLVAEGKFREDLLFRLSGKKLLLPPLRERASDITDLAQFFLSLERPRVNKMFSQDALQFLQTYEWPGNVRELKRICEQVALISPLPVIRKEDFVSLISPKVQVGNTDKLDLTVGLTSLVAQFEAEIITRALKQESDIDKVAQTLKISRSNLYKKIKDYNIVT